MGGRSKVLWLRNNDEWWYYHVYDDLVITHTIITNDLGWLVKNKNSLRNFPNITNQKHQNNTFITYSSNSKTLLNFLKETNWSSSHHPHPTPRIHLVIERFLPGIVQPHQDANKNPSRQKWLHPRSLTWPLKSYLLKSKVVFQPYIFRVYVTLQGCIQECIRWTKVIQNKQHVFSPLDFGESRQLIVLLFLLWGMVGNSDCSDKKKTSSCSAQKSWSWIVTSSRHGSGHGDADGDMMRCWREHLFHDTKHIY